MAQTMRFLKPKFFSI